MTKTSQVLLSWIAVENDPFQKERETGEYLLVNGQPVPGPTLTLLLDEESPFVGRIRDVVLFHRQSAVHGSDREQRAVKETLKTISEKAPQMRVFPEAWPGEDPTDHRSIFEFLRDRIPSIRQRFAGSELIIHISPGTPAMHTVWVLMAETGFVDPPFQLVKSYRKSERHGRPPVVAVEVGIETFYKAYKIARPIEVSSEDQAVLWDPARFQSTRMRELFTEARRFAQVKAPVLIFGERGTGKSTLAGWIRLHSPYRRQELDNRWPAVACGQYSPETMRAELFGYKKGAFTDAKSDKEGILHSANGDTLFLDEIGDVSRDLQRLLIKAIEEKQFFPLGSNRPQQSDFRLISATNLGAAEIGERLDHDFRDRIGTLTLRIPPLRETREELVWLWPRVYLEAATRAGAGKRQTNLAESHHNRVCAMLQEHPLPGNLRDLFRVAYRIISARTDVFSPLSPGDAIDYGLAALSEVGAAAGASSTSKAVAMAFANSAPLDAVLATAGRLATREIQRDLGSFMASEIRRIAKIKGLSPGDLSDVTERALRMRAKLNAKGK